MEKVILKIEKTHFYIASIKVFRWLIFIAASAAVTVRMMEISGKVVISFVHSPISRLNMFSGILRNKGTNLIH